jgi:hypothetical protein
LHLSWPRILAPWPLSIIHVRPASCHVSSCEVISPESHHATSPHCNVSIQHLSLHQASETSCHIYRSHSHAIPNSRTLHTLVFILGHVTVYPLPIRLVASRIRHVAPPDLPVTPPDLPVASRRVQNTFTTSLHKLPHL